jgi:hypothetical protein
MIHDTLGNHVSPEWISWQQPNGGLSVANRCDGQHPTASFELQIRWEISDEVVFGEGEFIGAFVDELEGAAAAGDDVEADAGLVGENGWHLLAAPRYSIFYNSRT